MGTQVGHEANGSLALYVRVRNKSAFSSFTAHTRALSFYGVILLSIVNLIEICGFSILSCIIGGQALASAANGQLSWAYVYSFG